MSPYESRTYPFPLKRYLESIARGPAAFTLRSKRFFGKRSEQQTRRTNLATEQLSLPLTTTTKSPTKGTQMANISDILNRPAEDVEPPKLLPAGSYSCIVKGLPEQGESRIKKTPYIRFSFQIIAPREDVEEEDITEYESSKDGEGRKIVGQIVTADYYATNEALFMLTDMLGNLGIDFTGGK